MDWFTVVSVVWFFVAWAGCMALSNHLRNQLRQRVAAEAVRTELGVRGSAWSLAFLSVSWLRTRFDLYLVDGRLVAIPSSAWTLLGAGFVFHVEDPGPVFRVTAFAPSSWVLTGVEGADGLILRGTSGVSSTRLTLAVDDPQAWAAAIERIRAP